VFVCAKSPLINIPLKVTVAAPAFLTFKVLARLLVPTLWALNFKFVGETDNAPAVAVAVGVADAVAVAVLVLVALADAVAVGVSVRTGVRAAVAEAVGVGVGVGVVLGVADGVAHAAGVADAESPTRKTCAWYGRNTP
jgi:hypothetical protein